MTHICNLANYPTILIKPGPDEGHTLLFCGQEISLDTTELVQMASGAHTLFQVLTQYIADLSCMSLSKKELTNVDSKD